MGASVSAVAGSLLVVASVVVKLIDVFRSHSIGANPTIEAIEEEAHRQAQVIRAQEEAKIMAAEMVQRARETQEEAERQAQVEIDKARRDQEKAERMAAEMAQRARETQAEVERQARGKEEELNRANAARKEVERKWREGIQPEVWPTKEELQTAQKRLQHTGDALHFAVAGAAGSGKSSLINAFCGLRNKDPGAARTGIVETTSEIARYPDPTPENPFVWYNVPGAGTLAIPDWQYFNAQGLYIFDCIIVLFDNRFTTIDVVILKHCARFKIPTYIVRSKSNQHIENMVQDMYESDDEDGNEDDYRAELYAMARDKYIEETRQSVRINLEAANLPQQKVYIVSKDTLLNLVKRRVFKDVIDELELLKDLLSDAFARRGVGKNRSSS